MSQGKYGRIQSHGSHVALKEQQILQELAAKYEVHPNQISACKLNFVQNPVSLFTKARKNEE